MMKKLKNTINLKFFLATNIIILLIYFLLFISVPRNYSIKLDVIVNDGIVKMMKTKEVLADYNFFSNISNFNGRLKYPFFFQISNDPQKNIIINYFVTKNKLRVEISLKRNYFSSKNFNFKELIIKYEKLLNKFLQEYLEDLKKVNRITADKLELKTLENSVLVSTAFYYKELNYLLNNTNLFYINTQVSKTKIINSKFFIILFLLNLVLNIFRKNILEYLDIKNFKK